MILSAQNILDLALQLQRAGRKVGRLGIQKKRTEAAAPGGTPPPNSAAGRAAAASRP
jgi:hypothetical protein